MSILKVDTIQTTSGAGLYTARAWVNFNGSGTVSIRNDGNVTSITDNGTGNYTVNFTTAMPNTTFAVLMSSKGQDNTTVNANNNPRPTAYALPTTSSIRIFGVSMGQVAQDAENISVATLT